MRNFTKKILFLTFLIFTSNCTNNQQLHDRENYVNTEISCPNQPKILASHALANEIVESVIEFRRKNPYQNAKYTVLTLKDNRSFQIKGMLADEVLKKCFFNEILRSQTNYAEYFYYF